MKQFTFPIALRFSIAGILLALANPAEAGTVQSHDLNGLERAGDAIYFAASPGAMAEAKARLAAHDPTLQPALKALISAANKALEIKPPTVMDKSEVPPSGDKHDYFSLATYWWPDPQKPDGLPYIRHDGKVNSETRSDAYDYSRAEQMSSAVQTLALAYYFTGKEAYAEHAAKCLRVWFLEPATRMNPNLKYTQAVPGENTGRGTGIIEGRRIADTADAAQLLAGSAAWTPKDQAEFKDWLETYLNWLLTSKNGRAEANARNNHGTWYDVQAVELALVLGKVEVAKQICGAAPEKRIAVQIKPDGQQPLELTRTAALGYSHFNLEALFTLATLSEHVGVDLWHCRLPNGQYALRNALNFLLPYVTDPTTKWPYQQIKPFNRAEFAPQLRQAALVYHEPEYEKILTVFPDVAKERFQLLCPEPSTKLDVAAIDRERILKAADAALALPPITITKYRAKLSEGGPNDYYSNGDYWWPNPNTTNGLPYVRRDGESNPGNFNAHRECVRQLRDAVTALGAAYEITGDDRYLKKAVELLRVFFLDPKTRMNPSLQYAQAIPGVSTGRGIGIIDTLHLIGVPKAIEVMEKSPTFPPDVLTGLKMWFIDYLKWMTTSKNGHDEANAPNNHAVAYWLQVAVFAQFVGNEHWLAECRQHYEQVFVPEQMSLNGSFPRELARTKPYGYSIFQLDNMATLCQVLSTTNDDLWTFTLPDGRGIRKAMEFLYPYLADKSKWPYRKDVEAWADWPAREPSLLFAGLAFHNQNYLNLWERLPAEPTNQEVLRNIAIREPLLWLPDFSATDNLQTASH
jgi:Alginate lyase